MKKSKRNGPDTVRRRIVSQRSSGCHSSSRASTRGNSNSSSLRSTDDRTIGRCRGNHPTNKFSAVNSHTNDCDTVPYNSTGQQHCRRVFLLFNANSAVIVREPQLHSVACTAAYTSRTFHPVLFVSFYSKIFQYDQGR